jgi:hypothetical protein
MSLIPPTQCFSAQTNFTCKKITFFLHPKIHVKPPHPLLANPLLQLGAAQNGGAHNPPTSSVGAPLGAAFGAGALGLPTPLMAQMRGEQATENGKKENQNYAYPNCSPRSLSERAAAGKKNQQTSERIHEQIQSATLIALSIYFRDFENATFSSAEHGY